MGNMSYCRFSNTLQDLQDCFDAIINNVDTDLSKAEMKAKNQLIELCHQIVEFDNDDCQSDEYMDS